MNKISKRQGEKEKKRGRKEEGRKEGMEERKPKMNKIFNSLLFFRFFSLPNANTALCLKNLIIIQVSTISSGLNNL